MQDFRSHVGQSPSLIAHFNQAPLLAKLVLLFLIVGTLSLVTSWTLAHAFKPVLRNVVYASDYIFPEEQGGNVDYGKILGPIHVPEKGAVYSIEASTNLPLNTWTNIEVEILDEDRDYLFSAAKELWRESGYDDGYYDETDNHYVVKVTFPEPGIYYFAFKQAGTYIPNEITVRVNRYYASAIPHFALGIICLLMALVLHEIRTKMILSMLKRKLRGR